jgi:hypothetical protein
MYKHVLLKYNYVSFIIYKKANFNLNFLLFLLNQRLI